MKNILTIIIFLTLVSCNPALITTTSTKIFDDIEGSYTPIQGQEKKEFFWGNDFAFGIWSFTTVLREGILNHKKQQDLENAKQQSLIKLNLIKTQYSSFNTYPEIINDGWHNIVATDNSNFCKDAKVFVKNNMIKKFVIDNYIPINFTATSSIKKAKNIISLKNFNGEQLNLLEIYFLYDLEQQNLVEAPKTGYVCFWTDMKRFKNMKLKMDGKIMEKFDNCFNVDDPECFTKGMVCRILKPGTYNFTCYGKGHISWLGSFDVKSGYCTKIKLGRK